METVIWSWQLVRGQPLCLHMCMLRMITIISLSILHVLFCSVAGIGYGQCLEHQCWHQAVVVTGSDTSAARGHLPR